MERIDIKLFKPQTTLEIIKGKFVEVEDPLEGKKIKFFNVTADDFLKMQQNEEILEGDTIDFLYVALPILTNIDMTIDKKEFREMCSKPSLTFAQLINVQVGRHITNILSNSITINDFSTEWAEFVKRNNLIVEPKKRTKEEVAKEIEELQISVFKIKDKPERKKVLLQIEELESELDELEKESKEDDIR